MQRAQTQKARPVAPCSDDQSLEPKTNVIPSTPSESSPHERKSSAIARTEPTIAGATERKSTNANANAQTVLRSER